MGTRGLYGFRKNGVDKTTYNHYDSYPSWLGENVVKFAGMTSIEDMNEIFDRIEMVTEGDVPTPEQIEAYRKFADTGVSGRRLEDWYCLLRSAQGDLSAYLRGCSHMINDSRFIKDSLFCEYAYIINLDTNKLEFWLGFQKEPDNTNRYGTHSISGYYPCKLMKEYDLHELQSDFEGSNEASVLDKYVDDMEKVSERYYEESETA